MISKQIKQLRKQAGMTQEELGRRLTLGKSTIAMYESGQRSPDAEIIKKIAQIFNVDINYIYGYQQKAARLVPVLGYVAAGIPIEAISEVIDYEELSADMVKDGAEYFALKIKGDSMAPRINTGDVVIVRKQEDVDSGQLAIVCINGDLATCKRLIKHDGGIMLQPLNQSYQPVFYSSSQIEDLPVTILGRVVELRAKF